MRHVIGIGSPFGPDRAAWQVIEDLRGRVPPDVVLTVLDRPGAALIHWLHPDDEVTLIDAASGGPSGSPYGVLRPADLASEEGHLDTHRQQLASTLALASVLGRLPERLEIYAIYIVADDILTAADTAPPSPPGLAEEVIKKLQEKASQPDSATSSATASKRPHRGDL